MDERQQLIKEFARTVSEATITSEEAAEAIYSIVITPEFEAYMRWWSAMEKSMRPFRETLNRIERGE